MEYKIIIYYMSWKIKIYIYVCPGPLRSWYQNGITCAIIVLGQTSMWEGVGREPEKAGKPSDHTASLTPSKGDRERRLRGSIPECCTIWDRFNRAIWSPWAKANHQRIRSPRNGHALLSPHALSHGVRRAYALHVWVLCGAFSWSLHIFLHSVSFRYNIVCWYNRKTGI